MLRAFLSLIFTLALLGAGALTYAQTATKAEPIRITAQALDIEHANGKATFKGQVRLMQGTFTLTANALEARYGTTLSTLTATGDVVITRGQAERATGATATYTPQTQTLTLTGPRVVLQRGPSMLVGDALTYNLATQSARVTKKGGPVEATFTPTP